MKSAKSNRSLRSIKSTRSTKSMRTNLGSKKGDVGGEFLDLAEALPMACVKFQCPYTVGVKKESQRDDFYKALKHGDAPTKRKKLSFIAPQPEFPSQQSDVKTSVENKSSESEDEADEHTLTVTAVYDTYNCLSEIALTAIKVPRSLMQIIGLLVPYFQNLTALTVKRCVIDVYIIYEISKLLDFSTINAVCLDDSPVLEQNYATLLSDQSNVRSLSLCRCKINDDACKEIAAKLHHGTCGQNLQVLNLSSNRITDIGVRYISDALRSNRRLRYLNLADNRITDDGANHILSVLIEFPLTHDEIIKYRMRFMKYLKCKQTLYLKYLTQYATGSFDELSQISRKSTPRRKKSRKEKELPAGLSSGDVIKGRAEMLVFEILGKFVDPFDSNSVNFHNDYHYCLGNMALSYLNLSYNGLSFFTIKKIRNVVMYQNLTKKSNETGLIKVVIDGNNLPMCKDMILLNELLDRNMKQHFNKAELSKRKNPLSKN